MYMLCDGQKPGKKGQGESGWAVQAKLDVYLWLGEFDVHKMERPYLTELAPGYQPQYENEDQSRPPIAIDYQGK